jgi:hypothetical protein
MEREEAIAIGKGFEEPLGDRVGKSEQGFKSRKNS